MKGRRVLLTICSDLFRRGGGGAGVEDMASCHIWGGGGALVLAAPEVLAPSSPSPKWPPQEQFVCLQHLLPRRTAPAPDVLRLGWLGFTQTQPEVRGHAHYITSLLMTVLSTATDSKYTLKVTWLDMVQFTKNQLYSHKHSI